MNILLVSEVYLPTVSGVASSTDSIARFMADRGHSVYLVCPKPVVSYQAPPQDGLEIIYTPTFRDPFFVDKSMALIPMGLWELLRVIRNHRIDVVHIQEPGALGIMALVLSKIYRLPVVGAMHFSMEQVVRIAPPIIRPFSAPFMRWYIRMIYPHYTAIMMPTHTVIKDLVALIGHPERIHAVSNGVDTKLYTPAKRMTSKHKNVSYLYLGRLDADKNLETILKAMSLVSPDIHFILAGVGKQKELLETLARSLGVYDRMTWVDKVSLDDIIKLYQSSDGFIIMSPVETQSIVALQAIACGLPVLAANAGALPELVRNGKNGYALPTFDEKMLAEKMMYLAGHPDVRERMGKESRKMSLKHEKKRVLRKLEQLYEEVCK